MLLKLINFQSLSFHDLGLEILTLQRLSSCMKKSAFPHLERAMQHSLKFFSSQNICWSQANDVFSAMWFICYANHKRNRQQKTRFGLGSPAVSTMYYLYEEIVFQLRGETVANQPKTETLWQNAQTAAAAVKDFVRSQDLGTDSSECIGMCCVLCWA